MSLDFSQHVDEDSWRFVAPHWVHVPVANDRHLVTLTGIVIVDFAGQSTDAWRWERLNLNLRFPTAFFPAGKWFQIEHWAPFVTLNAIYDKKEAIDAGWTVDAFGSGPHIRIYDQIYLWADIGVRDTGAQLYRVGYTLTVSGVFADPPSESVG